jgi:hypothetical protein
MLFIFLGLIGLAIDVVLVVAINSFTSFDVSTFSLFFIVPVGAMAIGALASLGYYIGILKSNKKISRSIRYIGYVFALVCFIAIQYGFYHTAYVGEDNVLNYKMKGEHISNYYMHDSDEPMNFISFTTESVNARVISFSNSGRNSIDVEGVKVVNWIFFAIDFLGMLAGSLFTRLLMFGDKKYCDNCKKYMKNKKLSIFSTSDTEKLNRLQSIAYANSEEIMALIQNDVTATNGDHYEFHLQWCPVCKHGYLQLKYMELDSNKKPNNKADKNIDIRVDSRIVQTIS